MILLHALSILQFIVYNVMIPNSSSLLVTCLLNSLSTPPSISSNVRVKRVYYDHAVIHLLLSCFFASKEVAVLCLLLALIVVVIVLFVTFILTNMQDIRDDKPYKQRIQYTIYMTLKEILNPHVY
uniref:Uncharacterized protein n=1 Tax=Glossina palpalis gambiensis TaxID=67801 RepID=A0A1B0C0T9_9MUSC